MQRHSPAAGCGLLMESQGNKLFTQYDVAAKLGEGPLTSALLTLSLVNLCCGGCPVPYRTVGSIPDLYPLTARGTPRCDT